MAGSQTPALTGSTDPVAATDRRASRGAFDWQAPDANALAPEDNYRTPLQVIAHLRQVGVQQHCLLPRVEVVARAQ